MGTSLYLSSTLLAILAYYLFDSFKQLSMESIFDNEPSSDFSSCSRVPEICGCEDIAIHYASGYAFSGCPENYWTHKELFKIIKTDEFKVSDFNSYFVSYNIKEKNATKLITRGFPEDVPLDMLGINLVDDSIDKNIIHLLAVNHEKYGRDSIVHFTHLLKSNEIVYIGSYYDECLSNINSIAALTPTSFYYTQFLTSKNIILNTLEKLGVLEGGKIMFYDESKKCQELVDGLKIPNGIAFSPDKSLIYVAESARGKLHIFNQDYIKLKQRKSISLNFIPDNIHVDSNSGHIYIAGYAPGIKEALKLATYNGVNNDTTAKSVVARVIIKPNEHQEDFIYSVEPILIDHEDTMFSTSVGAADESNGVLLLSGLFTGKGMFDCRLQL